MPISHQKPKPQVRGDAGLFSGKKTLMLHADNAKEIVEGVRFAQRQGVPALRW